MKHKLRKDLLLEILEGSTGKIIKDELIDTSRWSLHYLMIFEFDGKTYSVTYSRGATESQDEQPFEYEGEYVDCYEVKPVEKTVIEWVEVDD